MTKDSRLLQNMALKPFAGDQFNYSLAGNGRSFHPQDLIAVLQVKVDLVMREVGKEPGRELPGKILLLDIGFKNFYRFHL